MRIAIVGTGISGVVCADRLRRDHHITVFESDLRPGGHTNTVRVDLADETHSVDTGFLVFNDRTYPGFVDFLARLGVDSAPSDMSFSVRDERCGLEWAGTSLGSAFAQPGNALRREFLAMLRDIRRFNRAARALLARPLDLSLSTEEFVTSLGLSAAFREWYLIPMGAAIWSADPTTFTRYPAHALIRFFHNHGLLQLRDRPQWRTIPGGARQYVDAALAPVADRLLLGTSVEKVVRGREEVEVITSRGIHRFDHVVLATHSDQALAMLGDPTTLERKVLGAIRYQANQATLHTDRSMLPRARRAWASWNADRMAGEQTRVAVTYHLNRLQSLVSREEICVTLNRPEDIDPARVLAPFDYAHPVFDEAALGAQGRYRDLTARSRVSYAGAYWFNGFHEDGVQSALRVCRDLGVAS